MSVRSFFLIVSVGCLAAAALSAAFAATDPKPVAHQSLKSPSEFESIRDQAERSRAIFAEIGKLLTHPRCMSCHPAGDHPLQGADHHEHRPTVWRSDGGNLGTHCAECHTDNNVTLHEAASYQSIPGHPRWGLAPLSMAWEGKTVGDICRQLKDTSRNGGRDLALLQEHVAKDDRWLGDGIPEQAANPLREVRNPRGNCSKPGSTVEHNVPSPDADGLKVKPRHPRCLVPGQLLGKNFGADARKTAR